MNEMMDPSQGFVIPANLDYEKIKQIIFSKQNDGYTCLTLEALRNRLWNCKSGLQKNNVLFALSEYDVLGFWDT